MILDLRHLDLKPLSHTRRKGTACLENADSYLLLPRLDAKIPRSLNISCQCFLSRDYLIHPTFFCTLQRGTVGQIRALTRGSFSDSLRLANVI